VPVGGAIGIVSSLLTGDIGHLGLDELVHELEADRHRRGEQTLSHAAGEQLELLVQLSRQAFFERRIAQVDEAEPWHEPRPGAILTERLQAAGREVVEAAKMPAGDRRDTGKSDELDAVRIARAVLGLAVTDLRTPRALSTDRARVAMRVLVPARDQMTGERTRAVNALIALVRTIDLGIDARKPLTAGQIRTIAGWRNRDEDATTATCRHEAVRLAQRIGTLDCDLTGNRAGITELIRRDTPQLLELTGVGAVVAASVLIAWSHPGRVRSDAAMASLAGTCPIPASSGNTTRHRLNRGGDRRLNRALTTITIVRMRVDPVTRAYVARRRAEGRTTKEIMRSLKRYITRQLLRTLAVAHPIPMG